jgi:2-oxoisovalerate dehydrogenase E1 component beta subunit
MPDFLLPDLGEGLAEAEVIDLRSLSPVDDQTLIRSVRRTGRAVVIHEAAGFCGYGAEIAARLTERCFHYLQAPILRVTGFDIPYPAPMLEGHHLPSTDRILDAIARLQWDDEPDQRWLSPDGAHA